MGVRIVLAIAVPAVLIGGGVFVASSQSETFPEGSSIGVVDVSGKTQEQAVKALEEQHSFFQSQGIRIHVGSSVEQINLVDIEFGLNVRGSVGDAFIGGRASVIQRVLTSLKGEGGSTTKHTALIQYSPDRLREEIAAIAQLYDRPRKDIRFVIEGDTVELLMDTQEGELIDQEALVENIVHQLSALDASDTLATMRPDALTVDVATLPLSLEAARRMLTHPIALEYEQIPFTFPPPQIAGLITSEYRERQLVAGVDQARLAQLVTEVASQINIDGQATKLNIVGKKVVGFVPPRPGRRVEEEKLVALLATALEHRRDGSVVEEPPKIAIPVLVTHPVVDSETHALGIRELIGKATTTFQGSPPNRISNIKNGVRFLDGAIIAPGENFSTLGALGRIDNTTGYLPELVIKENRTVPEFGGGLCQVSTTLFRAVLNSGLPVTQRQNHSYRVSYYERDGEGRTIGPGLDATIYQPNPDFRFLNDTPGSIVIVGFTKGNTVSFELYGTKDGRTAAVDGPHTLSTIPAGPEIVVETDTLPKGQKKKLESAHPGGSAIATYTVTYLNGEVKTNVFKSSYRRWPARYLLGTFDPSAAVPTPAPGTPPTFEPTTTPPVNPVSAPVSQ